MNNNYPQNHDPRPKRRRDKDNPYHLFTVGINTKNPHYYISFIDNQGIPICMEIDKDVFTLLDSFELEDLSHLNKVDRHIEQTELNENILYKRAINQIELTEDVIMFDFIHTAIKRLPRHQRERLIMYYFNEMTLEEIARIQGCSIVAVYKSIKAAEKNLKKFLLEG